MSVYRSFVHRIHAYIYIEETAAAAERVINSPEKNCTKKGSKLKKKSSGYRTCALTSCLQNDAVFYHFYIVWG